MSGSERYRSIGERPVDPPIPSGTTGGVENHPSLPVKCIDIQYAPPPCETSHNSCPSWAQNDSISSNPISISASSSSSAGSTRNIISSHKHASNHNVSFANNSADYGDSDVVCSHPSQGVGHPNSPHQVLSSQSTMQGLSPIFAMDSPRSGPGVSGTVRDQRRGPTSTTSLHSLPERVHPETVSFPTFGLPPVTTGTATTPPSAARRSSLSISITTPHPDSRVTLEVPCDDGIELSDYHNSPHTSSSGGLRINHKCFEAECDPTLGPASPSVCGPRRPVIPSALRGEEDANTGGEERGMVTSRRPSGTLEDASSLHLVQAGRKQAVETGDAYDALNLQYILSGLSEGRVSFGSTLSFVQGQSGLARSSHLSSVVPFAASEGSLPLDESFIRHLQKYDRTFDARRHYWSFIPVKEELPTSGNLSKQTQLQSHAYPPNTGQAQTNTLPWIQETWSCGHVGRFRVRGTNFERDPQRINTSSPACPADPAKQALQQIHIRQITKRNSANSSHSVIHKHPRAIAFSIFRMSNGLPGGKSGNATSTSTAPAYMDIRAGIMLAPKKIQQKYARTKSTNQPAAHADPRDLRKEPSRATYDRKGKCKETSEANQHSATSPRTVSSNTLQFSQMGSTRESSANLALHSDSRTSNVREHDTAPLTPTSRKAAAPPPCSVEPLRTDTDIRGSGDSGSTLSERFFRIIRGSSRTDPPSSSLAGKFQYMIGSSRTAQEEINPVNSLNASLAAVGLLPSNTAKPSSKRKSDHTFLGQIPDDCLCMTLPLWASETGGGNNQSQETSVALPTTTNSRFLIIYYVPIDKADSRGDKMPHKNAKQSHPSTSGVSTDFKSVHLPAFHVVARVIDHSELLLSGLKVLSGGLAVDSPASEREAIGCLAPTPHRKLEMTNTIVCHCHSRDRGFDFVAEGLCQLGLCTQEEVQTHHFPGVEEEERESEFSLTPLGKIVVEFIWLGCIAVTSFSPA